MGASTAAFERVINLSLEALLPPEARRTHARIAREGLAAFVASMPEAPDEITTYVDGREGASEETVRFGGVIRYEIRRHDLSRIAARALSLCVAASPDGPGKAGTGKTQAHYRDAWIVILLKSGREIARFEGGETVFPTDLRPDEIVVVNTEPYHRKLEVGANATEMRRNRSGRLVVLPSGIVERVRVQIAREYGASVDVTVRYIPLPGGYALKGRQKREYAKEDRRSSAFRAGRALLSGRRDTREGQPMTYPALALRRRT